jgi:hypothetical protein
MLHSLLFTPFDNPAHQALYEAVYQALALEAAAEPTALLGNFAVGEAAFDAVIVRPRSITVLLFVTGQGLLTSADLTQTTWQLGGQPVANPYPTFRQQQPVLAAWLGPELSAEPLPTPDITGLALFTGPVAFDPGIEQQLRQQPAADGFQLLRHAEQLPRRLWQLARTGINLPAHTLRAWAGELSQELDPDQGAEPGAVAQEMADLVAPIGFWEHKAQQLWRWLGAEDIPHDPPYGSFSAPPTDPTDAGREEMRRLEQIRQQVRTEVQAQSQATVAREAEREQLIRQLQEQLRQSSALAPETAALQARLAAETQEKAALQEGIRVAQAESAARNQALDARIEQLGSLLQELRNRPAAAAAAPLPPAAPVAPRPATTNQARPVVRTRLARSPWQLQWHRAAVVAAVAGALGWGVWGVVHISRQLSREPAPTPRAARRGARPAAVVEADVDDTTADSVQAAQAAEQAEADTQDSAVTMSPAPADSSEVLAPVAEPELDDTSPGPRR